MSILAKSLVKVLFKSMVQMLAKSMGSIVVFNKYVGPAMGKLLVELMVNMFAKS